MNYIIGRKLNQLLHVDSRYLFHVLEDIGREIWTKSGDGHVMGTKEWITVITELYPRHRQKGENNLQPGMLKFKATGKKLRRESTSSKRIEQDRRRRQSNV